MQRLFIAGFVFILLAAPFFVSAQTTGALVPCNGPECEACHVIELGQNIINFLVSIAAFIAMVVFAVGGFYMVTAAGDTGKVSKAKEMFTAALVGIVILLAGWLIVDTVMKYAFVGSQLDREQGETFGPWNQIECVPQPQYQEGVPRGSGGGITVGGGSGSCRAMTSGPCSADSLRGAFGSAASAASQICNVESRGIPTSRSRVDILKNSGNRPFSIGLFQVNLTVHQLSCNGRTLNCPSAFRGTNYNATIVNERLYNECVVMAADSSCNIQKAKQLYQARGSNWGDWRNSANKCGL